MFGEVRIRLARGRSISSTYLKPKPSLDECAKDSGHYRHFQPLASPDPFNTLLVHRPAGPTQQRRDPAISVAAILAGKLNDVGRQCGLIIWCRRSLSLRRLVLTQCPACPSLGDAKLGRHMIHARAAAGGA